MANEIPLPTYYNNPGALIPNPQWKNAHHYWEGQVGISPEGLAIFTTPEFGHKALDSDLRAAIKEGHNTIRKLTKFYAGTDPDATSAALQNKMKLMLARSGLKDENAPIDLDKHLSGIHQATADFEVGGWSPNDIKNVNLQGAPEETSQTTDTALPPASNQAQVDKDLAEHQGETVPPSTTSPRVRQDEKNIITAAGAFMGAGASALGQGIGFGINKLKGVPKLDDVVRPNQSLQSYLTSQWQNTDKPRTIDYLRVRDLQKAIRDNVPGYENFKIRTTRHVQRALNILDGLPEETVPSNISERVARRDPEHWTNKKIIPATEPVDVDPYATSPFKYQMQENILPAAGRLASGIVGGAIAFPSAVQAMQSYKEKDYPYMAAKGVEALGGLGMAVPFIPFMKYGAGLAGLGGLSSAALERTGQNRNQVGDILSGTTNLGMMASVAPQVSEAAPKVLAPSIAGTLGRVGAGILSAPVQGAMMALTPSEIASQEEEMAGMGASYKQPSYMQTEPKYSDPALARAKLELQQGYQQRVAELKARQSQPKLNPLVNTLDLMGSGDFTP